MDFRQRLFRNRYWVLAACLIATAFAVEIICRFGLGLGDPPLEILDPACGYRFRPSQSVHRFGNRITYDADSTRGGKSAPPDGKVFTTLVIGDSVLNGGALTDDEDTPTGVLNDLRFGLSGGTLRFLNLSAGSWAPPQQLGYLNAYGTLGADSVVLVMSSHDILGRAQGDYAPFPTQSPWTATEEAVMRYLLRRRQHLFTTGPGRWEAAAAEVPGDVVSSQEPGAIAMWCLSEIAALCRRKNLPFAVVLWPERSEAVGNRWEDRVALLRQTLDTEKVPRIELMDAVRSTPGFPDAVYRDMIHPTVAGQRMVAGAVLSLRLQMAVADQPGGSTAADPGNRAAAD